MTVETGYINDIKLNIPTGEQLIGKTTNDFTIKVPKNGSSILFTDFTFKVDAQGNVIIE